MLHKKKTYCKNIYSFIYICISVSFDNDTCPIYFRLTQDGRPGLAKYGTTAEIYEYQEEDFTQTMSIKAKGRQRFKVISTHRESTGLVLCRMKPGMHAWQKHAFCTGIKLDVCCNQ